MLTLLFITLPNSALCLNIGAWEWRWGRSPKVHQLQVWICLGRSLQLIIWRPFYVILWKLQLPHPPTVSCFMYYINCPKHMYINKPEVAKCQTIKFIFKIGDRFALTAAHCLFDDSKTEVFLACIVITKTSSSTLQVLPASSFSLVLGVHDRRVFEPNRYLI